MPKFTSATAAAAAVKSHASRRGSGELKQALALQDLLYKAAQDIGSPLSRGENLSREAATTLAQLGKGWDTVSNRIRILRGKPLPGSRRPPATVARPTDYKPRNLPPPIPMFGTSNPKTV